MAGWSLFKTEGKLSDYFQRTSLPELKKRLRILVIDDEPKTFPTEFFRREGYTIESWKKVESMQRLEAGEFHIIVLDIGGVAKELGPEDGIAVLRSLKQTNPEQIIVAFSGQQFDVEKNVFFRLADDTIRKPTDALVCKERIDNLILSRFSVEHIWRDLTALIVKEGFPEKKAREVERAILRATRGGPAVDARKLFPTLVENAAKFSTIATFILRLTTLC